MNLNNEWVFENVSSDYVSKMKVQNISSIENQDFYYLDNPEFIFGYEKLFYNDNDLFTFNRDSIEILLIKNKSEIQGHVFEGRILFQEEESIEVPAGTFKCQRVLHTVRYGFNTRTTSIWFCYGIGPIMKTFIHQYQTETVTSTKYELKSYKLY